METNLTFCSYCKNLDYYKKRNRIINIHRDNQIKSHKLEELNKEYRKLCVVVEIYEDYKANICKDCLLKFMEIIEQREADYDKN